MRNVRVAVAVIERRGRAARRTVEERFAIARIGQAYAALYQELLSSR